MDWEVIVVDNTHLTWSTTVLAPVAVVPVAVAGRVAVAASAVRCAISASAGGWPAAAGIRALTPAFDASVAVPAVSGVALPTRRPRVQQYVPGITPRGRPV
jgi:hypothetical protein